MNKVRQLFSNIRSSFWFEPSLSLVVADSIRSLSKA
jgi:hypothetical protein